MLAINQKSPLRKIFSSCKVFGNGLTANDFERYLESSPDEMNSHLLSTFLESYRALHGRAKGLCTQGSGQFRCTKTSSFKLLGQSSEFDGS